MEPASPSAAGPSSNQNGRLQSVVLTPAPTSTPRSDRREKVRCEACRSRNLECNGRQPCSFCAWDSRECNYIAPPVSTAGHRGIPRCDPCRLRNLKCNRQMPVCDNCMGQDERHCIYTPKMRASGSIGDSFVSGFVPPSMSGIPPPEIRGPHLRIPTSTTSYDRNVKENRTGRTAVTRFINTPGCSLPLSSPIKPWTHPSYMPLPAVVAHHLAQANAAEMPSRSVFDESLSSFLLSLMPELRDTACFTSDVYASMAKAIATGDRTKVPIHVERWMSCHPLRLGSRETNFLVIPRDDVYQSPGEQHMLKEYRVQVDSSRKQGRGGPMEAIPGSSNPSQGFNWIPTRDQIYDILAYAHRDHAGSFAMIQDVERLLVTTITWPMAEIFCQLCPVCTIQQNSKLVRQ